MSAVDGWLTDERWWSAAEVAEVIGKTERWVIERCAPEDSAFPHHRVGRDPMFSRDDRRRYDEMTARGRGPAAAEQVANDQLLDVALAGIAKRQRPSTAAAAAH